MFKKILFSVGILASTVLLMQCFQTSFGGPNVKLPEPVWADEFSGEGHPDPTKWSYDVGDGCPNLCGWGNNELEYYTENTLKNARVEGGLLIIEAHKEKMGNRDFTSARLVSKKKGDWTYGRIEVRARIPSGRGVWPAIWMLSTDWEYGGWPASGEIDIMEHVGYSPDSVFATVHTNTFNGMIGTQVTKGIKDKTLDSGFHIYELDWNKEKIDFYFDGEKYHSYPNDGSGFEAWPFDKNFHMILNVAVGGNWGGKMGIDPEVWPQRMEVDYVRVYQ